MHLTSNPAFERTCAKSRAGRSTQTIRTSPQSKYFLWRAVSLFHVGSPRGTAREVSKRSDCESITGLVMGNQVPGPQCKPRVRSSIVSRHDVCPRVDQVLRTPV